MNILKRIRDKLEELIPFFKKEKKPSGIIYFKDIETALTLIRDKQQTARKKAIEGIKQRNIIKLTSEQESLAIEKSKTLNITNSEQEFKELKNIVYQIELLETNKLLQEQIIFKIKHVESELIEKLEREIETIAFQNETLSVLTREHELKETNRKKEIIANSNLKEIALNYSLVKIHNKREVERREKERIEKERKLTELYNFNVDKAITSLNVDDFAKAREYLDSALKIKPSYDREIKKLESNIHNKQKEYNKRKTEFKKLFDKAENAFHENQFKKAVELFTQAQTFDVDNYRCNRRISDAQSKIERILQREAERKRIEQEEKERHEKFKDDAQKILQYYEQNGITEFYHYTDSRNINSIIQNNGLFSINEMNRKNIEYKQGSETWEMPDYVRMSYTKNHPLMYVSEKAGRIQTARILNVNRTIATLRKTKFSNVNAARTSSYPTVKIGDDLNFIRNNVKLNIVKQRNHFNLTLEEKPYYQAEILVKEHVPLEYITNL
jgi:hypothetical protein